MAFLNSELLVKVTVFGFRVPIFLVSWPDLSAGKALISAGTGLGLVQSGFFLSLHPLLTVAS